MFKLFIILSMLSMATTASCQDLHDAPITRRHPVQHGDGETDTNPEEEFGHMESISFNGGFHTEFVNAVQTDSSGTSRKFQFSPTIGMGGAFRLSPNWHFVPEVNWVLPQFSDKGHIMKNIFMIRADFGYDVLDWLRLRVGTSLIWLNQHGFGGKAKMNNGNSSSTFYYPSENRSSLNNTLDLGVEAKFSENWSARVQTYTYALFREDRRQVSYTLFLTYYWKQ